MSSTYTRLAILLSLIGIGLVFFLPRYKANPAFIQSIASLRVLRELPGASLRSVAVARSDQPDISFVTVAAASSKRSTSGRFLTEENTTLSYRSKTKSRCLELKPGCLEMQHESISEAVSVRLLM